VVPRVTVSPGLIGGDVDEGYGKVADVFRRNMASGQEVGAAVAVYREGVKVVDLWGGFRNGITRAMWEEDTLVNMFSTTKGVAARSRENPRQLGDAPGVHRVVVAPGEERRMRWRAQRRRVETVVTQAIIGGALKCRGIHRATERAGMAKTDVVEQDQQDVRRTVRCRGHRRDIGAPKPPCLTNSDDNIAR
jgi:hypothetical protein